MLTTIVVLLVVALTMAAAQEQPKWTLVMEHAAFSQRDTAEDAVFLGKMWISNAYNTEGKLTQDLWNSTDGVTWTKVMEPTPYDGYAEMVVFQGKLWAIKGRVWNTSDGINWTKLGETPFGARSYGECVVFQDKIWQLGSGNDVWNTSDGTNWTCVLKDAPFESRFGSAVAVYDNKLWLCGGAVNKESDPPEKHYKQFTTYNDVWSSPDGEHWTRVTEHAPWAERQWFVAREYAGKLWIFGGFSNRESKNFAESWYTTDGVKWTLVQSDPMWSPRHEPTIYVYEGSLWLAAGNSWPLTNDVWKLTAPAGWK